MKTAFIVSAAFLLLVGCASAPPALPDPTRQIDPDPFQVKADKEVFGLRVDLYRNERRGAGTTDLSGGNSTSSVPIIDAWDYALTGIDAGSGLFLDTNGNLAVDLVRLYDIKPPFHIEETVAGLVPYKISYLFHGSTFQRTGGATDLPDQTVALSGDGFAVSTQQSKSSIYPDSNTLVYALGGFHLTSKVVLKQVSPERVELQGILGNASYIVRNEYEVDLTNKFKLEDSGKVLTITLGGAMLGNGAAYRYVKTLEGCWFADPKGNTHEISLVDNTITVSKNGKVEKTYKILPTD
jgi:hypothetical protein